MNNNLQRITIDNNPLFRYAIGLCPALALTDTLSNALAIGIIIMVVLMLSNFTVAATRSVIPYKLKTPFYIIVIATFASCIEIIMQSKMPVISAHLGVYIPLTAVNCIILGQANSFASKNKVIPSFVNGMTTGFGFTFALLICAFVRELIGANQLFGITVFKGFAPIHAFSYACGGFFTIGIILAIINYMKLSRDTVK